MHSYCRLVLSSAHNVKCSSVSHFQMVLMDIDIIVLVSRTDWFMGEHTSKGNEEVFELSGHSQ